MTGGSAEALERGARRARAVQRRRSSTWASPAPATSAKLLNNFLNAVTSGRDRRGDGRGEARPGSTSTPSSTCSTPSSGVNFATLNRFPHIIEGDYLEGGRASALMTKDVALRRTPAQLGVPMPQPARPLASFGRPPTSGTATRSATAWSTPSATSPAVFASSRTRRTVIVRISLRLCPRNWQADTEKSVDRRSRAKVLADPVLGGEEGIMVANVFFEPGSAHALAHARDGAGAARARRRGPAAVARRDGRKLALQAGDVAHIPRAQQHRHGAAPGSYLLHLAVLDRLGRLARSGERRRLRQRDRLELVGGKDRCPMLSVHAQGLARNVRV